MGNKTTSLNNETRPWGILKKKKLGYIGHFLLPKVEVSDMYIPDTDRPDMCVRCLMLTNV